MGLGVDEVEEGPRDSTGPRFKGNAQCATKMLQTLCRDELGMKKLRRAIGGIGIQVDGTGGVFAMWTTQWPLTRGQRALYTNGPPFDPLLDHARRFFPLQKRTLVLQQRNLGTTADLLCSRGL
jgi:hypothetical protein